MSGLVLKLSPKERVLLNGAVIENGDKRSKFSIVTPNAKILRLKDALHPNEVNSPVSHACYTTQLVLSGDRDADTARLIPTGHIQAEWRDLPRGPGHFAYRQKMTHRSAQGHEWEPSLKCHPMLDCAYLTSLHVLMYLPRLEIAVLKSFLSALKTH